MERMKNPVRRQQYGFKSHPQDFNYNDQDNGMLLNEILADSIKSGAIPEAPTPESIWPSPIVYLTSVHSLPVIIIGAYISHTIWQTRSWCPIALYKSDYSIVVFYPPKGIMVKCTFPYPDEELAIRLIEKEYKAWLKGQVRQAIGNYGAYMNDQYIAS
jgi:hypothetical protein